MKKVNSHKSELINKMFEEFNIKSVSDLQEAMKELFGQTIQNMLRAEFDEHMGYEKSNNVVEKSNYRNGYSKKSVNTVFGEIDLDIPRVRNAEFEPVIVPKSKRDISGIEEKNIRLYGRGMSTRDISAELNELYGCELSPTMISKITDKVNNDIEEWQNRPLEERYAIVFIDCIYNSVKVEGKVQKLATYVVLGIDLAVKKDILSLTTSETEIAHFWHKVLLDLKNRGVKDIMIFCSDGLNGIVEAIEFAFPCAVYQRCVVHMVRNTLRYVNRKDYKEFCGDQKSV